MAHRRVHTLDDCARFGLTAVQVACDGCGRRVTFDTRDLIRFCREKGLPLVLRWLGPKFVCRGRADIQGCGHRGATLTPFLHDPNPPGPPIGSGEWVPLGVDRAAWAKATDRERKQLVRRARGAIRIAGPRRRKSS